MKTISKADYLGGQNSRKAGSVAKAAGPFACPRPFALKSESDAVLPPLSRVERGTDGGAEQFTLLHRKQRANTAMWSHAERVSHARPEAVSHLERARAHGLVYGSYLTVYPDGRLLQLHLPGIQEHKQKSSARGKCDGMSDDSRRRLMRLLHSIDRREKNPAFVTLTFPDECIPSPREAKRMLQTLCKRWQRRQPRLCAIWRMEAHPERSERLGKPVPHLHLLVWGDWIEREALSRDWSDIVCGNSAQAVFWKHLAAGTKVESIRSFRGVASYASKYLSKADGYSLGEDAGRVWGIFNGAVLPLAKGVCVKLSTEEVVRVVRWAKRLLKSKGVVSEWMPKTIYMERPNDVLRLLDRGGEKG